MDELDAGELVLSGNKYSTCPTCEGDLSVFIMGGMVCRARRNEKQEYGVACRHCMGWGKVPCQRFLTAAKQLGLGSGMMPKPLGKSMPTPNKDTWVIRTRADGTGEVVLAQVIVDRGKVVTRPSLLKLSERDD